MYIYIMSKFAQTVPFKQFHFEIKSSASFPCMSIYHLFFKDILIHLSSIHFMVYQ